MNKSYLEKLGKSIKKIRTEKGKIGYIKSKKVANEITVREEMKEEKQIEGKVNLENISLNLIDTAGIRESKDIVENIGIDKSKKALEKADLVLLVLDASNIDDKDEELLKLTEDKNRIIVYNKSDLKKIDGISICAKDNDISELTTYLNKLYEKDVKLVDEDILNNERQIALMKQALNELEMMKEDLEFTNLDVLELNLESAYHYLALILGKEYREDLIDHMFRNFCLGK